MRRAFARSQRLDLRGEVARLGVIIHAGRGEGAVMVIDRQDRAGSRIDRDGAGAGEVELLAEFVEGRAAAVPPVFGRLFAAGTRGLGRRKRRRTERENLSGGIDGDGTDTGGT